LDGYSSSWPELTFYSSFFIVSYVRVGLVYYRTRFNYSLVGTVFGVWRSATHQVAFDIVNESVVLEQFGCIA
jgi:hypothetical protein